MAVAQSHIQTEQQTDNPVTIVGAGPAGLICAIVMAGGGRRVIVREWHETVGSRFHGDFQGLENWSGNGDVLDEMRATGIEANFDCHPVYESTVFDAWGEAYPVRDERPLYYLVHRGEREGSLDHGLLKQAIEAGVEVRFGDRVSEIAGPAVLAIGPRVADAIAVGYVFETDNADGSWIAFDNTLAPLGYAYLLIHRGRGTIASCMFTDFKQQAQYIERTVSFFRERVGLEMRNAAPFGGFANFRLPDTAIQGGHPVVGEQAGFQDALAGFGMRYALRSGILAARSQLEGDDYTRLWRQELLPLLRTGVSNRFIFNCIGERGWRWMIRRLTHADTNMKLKRLYQPSLLTRLVFPLAHWRYRAPLQDPSCDHVDCHCVWCRCGGHSVIGATDPF